MIFPLVIDLKVIRAGIDTLFDMVSSSPEIKIKKILSRSDHFVDNLEYVEMAKDQLTKLTKDKTKQDNFKDGLTTIFGAIMQKQKCWEKCACTIGSLVKDFPAKEFMFL